MKFHFEKSESYFFFPRHSTVKFTTAMRTFQFVFGAFATLNAVYGLPTTDASIESSLAKRDKHDLPYDFEVYKDCLHNDFKDSCECYGPQINLVHASGSN